MPHSSVVGTELRLVNQGRFERVGVMMLNDGADLFDAMVRP